MKNRVNLYLFSCVVIIDADFKVIATENYPLLALHKLTRANRHTTGIPLTDDITCAVVPDICLSREERRQNPRFGRVHINALHAIRVVDEKLLNSNLGLANRTCISN